MGRIFRTIRFLKFKQILYLVKREIANYFFSHKIVIPSIYSQGRELDLCRSIEPIPSWSDGTFTFVNIDHSFSGQVDWDYNNYGKLWTYNLNYFEFILQNNMTQSKGKEYIDHYIENIDSFITGWDPYPASIRLQNWIKYIIKWKIRDDTYDRVLFATLLHLKDRLEYHLMGNHLLENIIALVFGAIYFNDTNIYKKVSPVLKLQIEEQILPGGAHFELSPMYHQLLTFRLLDLVNLIKSNNTFGTELLPFLEAKISYMLGWLKYITFRSGEIPHFNDSTNDIAPNSSSLISYAERLGIYPKTATPERSGYFKCQNIYAELVVDIGDIGPTYIPGHAHADSLGFVLSLWELNFIVDTGISTYEKNRIRSGQRGTSAHNTVTIGESDSSEVWGGFRVGRRAKAFGQKIVIGKSTTEITSAHNGFKWMKGRPVHQRTWKLSEGQLQVYDSVTCLSKLAISRFYFDPDVQIISYSENHFSCRLPNQKEVHVKINEGIGRLTSSEYCLGFNRVKKSMCLEVSFIENISDVTFSW